MVIQLESFGKQNNVNIFDIPVGTITSKSVEITKDIDKFSDLEFPNQILPNSNLEKIKLNRDEL